MWLGNFPSQLFSGNRFRDTKCPVYGVDTLPFRKIEELALDNTLLSWHDIASITSNLPALTSLSISATCLLRVISPLNLPFLTALDLSSNNITSLDGIIPLGFLPKLGTLSLRNNPLRDLTSTSPQPVRFPSLERLDLSSTLLPNLLSLGPIPQTFPNLTSLLIKNTPLSALPSSNLYTIARLATLKELNYQPITPAERQNAELYYLSTIAKELATTSIPNQPSILAQHPRWSELCEIHGTPDFSAPKPEAAAGTLGARVTEFTFYMAPSPSKSTQASTGPLHTVTKQGEEANNKVHQQEQQEPNEKRKLIPLTVDTYRLKGIVTRLFELPPMGCRLIWETGEMDPVGREDEEGWSVSEDEDDEEDGRKPQKMGKEKGKWVEREVELVDGTREVGNLVEGKRVRVRVELR